MSGIPIGIPGGGRDSAAAVASLAKIEQRGLTAGWLTSASGLDPVAIATVAAGQTSKLLLGTSITHTWPIHPVKMAQLGQVAAQLSGGRFRLGLGVTAKAAVEAVYGQEYQSPLGHLREYVQIVKALTETGEVNFEGKYFKTSTKMAGALTPMPVMIAALQPKAFALAGEVADGAISWVTPGTYIRDTAAPALREAAAKAGRTAPPIVMHVPLAVHENQAEVREAFKKQFSFYVRAPHYQAMFAAAGFPESAQAAWSDAMIDAVAVSGSAAQVEEQLHRLIEWGVTELLVSPIAGLGDEATGALLSRLAA